MFKKFLAIGTQSYNLEMSCEVSLLKSFSQESNIVFTKIYKTFQPKYNYLY